MTMEARRTRPAPVRRCDKCGVYISFAPIRNRRTRRDGYCPVETYDGRVLKPGCGISKKTIKIIDRSTRHLVIGYMAPDDTPSEQCLIGPMVHECILCRR